MNLFKNILQTVLIYLVIFFTVWLAVYSIADVNKYADEAVAIECQCRDGNFDNAGTYMVSKSDDGSYTVEFAARGLEDLIVTAHYDADGNYLYTSKNVASYIILDIVASIFIGAVGAGFAYLVYVLIVVIVEAIANHVEERKNKKAKLEEESEVVDDDSKDIEVDEAGGDLKMF